MKPKRRDILDRFRAIPGELNARYSALLAELKAEGMKITFRGLADEIRDAKREERAEKRARVLELIGRGLSVREVARRMGIPFTSVSTLKLDSRWKKKKRS